jgi:hypothetical protein
LRLLLGKTPRGHMVVQNLKCHGIDNASGDYWYSPSLVLASVLPPPQVVILKFEMCFKGQGVWSWMGADCDECNVVASFVGS